MHGIGYWIMHFLLAAVSMFVLLVGIDLASGVKVEAALWYTLAWAVVAAAIFTGARYSQARRQQGRKP